MALTLGMAAGAAFLIGLYLGSQRNIDSGAKTLGEVTAAIDHRLSVFINHPHNNVGER